MDDRDSDIEPVDIMEANEFPYMSDRLKDIDFEEIVKKGKPWTDKSFNHPGCLYKDKRKPIKATKTKDKWAKYEWKRASEYFGEGNYELFDGVDPTDIMMGSCNNCYAFAALAGIAESTDDEQHMTKD